MDAAPRGDPAPALVPRPDPSPASTVDVPTPVDGDQGSALTVGD